MIHTFKVRHTASWSKRFPIDMLRYDTCWPARQEDASEISLSLSVRDTTELELKAIELRTEAPKAWKPTAARWQSFGWEVITEGR